MGMSIISFSNKDSYFILSFRDFEFKFKTEKNYTNLELVYSKNWKHLVAPPSLGKWNGPFDTNRKDSSEIWYLLSLFFFNFEKKKNVFERLFFFFENRMPFSCFKYPRSFRGQHNEFCISNHNCSTRIVFDKSSFWIFAWLIIEKTLNNV